MKKVELCRVLDDYAEYEGENEQESEVEAESRDTKAGISREKLSLDSIHAAVNGSKLINHGDQDLRWVHKEIDQGRKDIYIALLLPLLPNLTVLSIAHCSYLSELYAMIERAPQLDPRFLSKVEKVYIEHYNNDRNPGHFLLDHVKTFILLPSLRRLSARGAYLDGWSRELLEPHQISNAISLDLRECEIGSRLLDQFLRHFPYSQSFVYTNSPGRYSNGKDFDPFIIRAALQARVSTTLRRLTILNLKYSNSGDETFMGPLCDFKVLEHVHSEWDCLVPYVGADVENDEREILSLILPKSLRVLSVTDHNKYRRSKHKVLIHHAIQAKTGPDAHLPFLETLVFSMPPETVSVTQRELCDGADQGLQQRCDEVGLSLRFTTIEPFGACWEDDDL